MGSKNGKPVLREEDIAALSKSSGLDSAEVKETFELFIAKHPNGFIDFTEFMLVFHIMSDGTVEEVLTKIFRVFDVNGDGVISIKEMNKLIKDMYGLLKTEDPNIAAKNMIAKTAFAEMDKNEDGQVSKEEFVKACMGQEQISKMITLKIVDIFVDDEYIHSERFVCIMNKIVFIRT